jgi:HD-like signal output (HDOD) protein
MALSSTATVTRTDWTEWIRSGRWEEDADTAIPMLPASAQEIVGLAMDPNIEIPPIVKAVSKDPVLATRVVQLANSAFSASSKEITTINEAVVRLGTDLVRTVMTSTCMNALAADPKIYGRYGRDYIDHSVGTAYVSWLIANDAGEEPAEAFLYGLLHDVGKLLVIKVARQAAHYSVEPPNLEQMNALMAEKHAEFGAYLLKQWGLPSALLDPVGCHHAPERATDRPQAAAVAYAANRLAHRYGFACLEDDFDPLQDPVCAQVGITPMTLARLDQQAPVMYKMALAIRR